MKSLLCMTVLMVGMLGVVNNASAYAALAIDHNQGDRWGFSYDYPNDRAARQRALSECGKGCNIVKSFTSGCGAYAADQAYGGTAYGWGNASSEVEAKNLAMHYCRQYGGTECIIRVWACNSH